MPSESSRAAVRVKFEDSSKRKEEEVEEDLTKSGCSEKGDFVDSVANPSVTRDPPSPSDSFKWVTSLLQCSDPIDGLCLLIEHTNVLDPTLRHRAGGPQVARDYLPGRTLPDRTSEVAAPI
jgi:hypothetical protein